MASSSMGNIRGITITLGGDSSGLVKSFKEVNTAAKQTGNALKDVNKLLKVDPGNITLLKQKQTLLNRTIEETAEKLKLAEKAKADLLAKGDTEKNQRQLEALNREIEDLKRKLGEAKKEAEGFSVVGESFKAVGNNIKNIGSQITSFGQTMTQRVTVPIVGAATATMAAWKQVDNAYDTVIAKTGATGESLEGLKKNVDNLATSIPTTFENAAIAIGEVNTRFGLTGEELEKVSAQFIKFAKLNQVDLNSAIDSVQKSMAAFGLSAEQTGEYLDTLNAVGQNTGINVGKLSDLMMSNSTALRSMGMNAADAAVLLGTLEKSGADTSLVMQGFSKVQKEAMESGVSMQQAFREALSSSDKAIEIFGSKAGPKLYELFRNGTLSIDMFTGGVNNLDDALGNLDKTFEATVSPTDKLQMALNELLKIGHELGEVIGEELAPIITEITALLKQFSEWFKQLDPQTKQMIVRAAAITAALGPVIVVVGSIISAIGSIVHGIGSVISVGSGIIKFFTATSETAGGTSLALKGLGTTFTALKGTAVTVGSAITGAFSTVGTVLTTTIAGPVALAVAGVGAAAYSIYTNWDKLGQTFQAVGQLMKAQINLFVADANLLATKGKIAFDNFANGAKTAISNGMNTVKTAVSTGLTTANSFITNFGTNARNTFQTTMANLQSRTSGAMSSIRTAISSGVNSASSSFNSLKTNASSAFSAMQTNATSAMNTLKTNVVSVANTVKDNVSSAWDLVKSKSESTWSSIKSTASTTWGNIQTTISGHINTIKNDISTTFGNAMSTASSKMNALKSDSSSIWSSISSSITSAINSIKTAVSNTTLKFGSVTIPTFSWSGSNDSTKGTTAKINVSSKTVSYASAMMGGAILKGATIFGAMGDKLLQAGEVGSEVVVGTNSLMNMIARTSRANSNNAAVISGLGAIYTLLAQYLPESAENKAVVLDNGKLVGALVPAINRQLGLMMG